MQQAPMLLNRQVFWIVVLLVLFGQVMLFSASGVLGIQRHGSEFYFISKQASTALLGFVLMVLLARIRLSFLRKLAIPFLLAEIVLVAMTYFPGIGHSAGGATRWLSLGGFIFQPSELSKITVSLYLSHILAVNEETPFTPNKWLLSLLPLILLMGLIFKQPDMGSTVLLSVTILCMFFLSGVKIVYVFSTVAIAIIGFAVAMLHSDYRRKRFFAFLNPWADPQGTGFQSIQSFVSFHSGRVFGVGIGNGNSKLFYLPEVHTDFIYALIAEELGFVGAVILLLTFLYLIFILFKTASKAPDSFSSLLGFGLALSLALQICVNLGGVTGLLPVKGLPLPFISWGRSALLVNFCMVGILLNVGRQSGNNQPS